MQAFKGFSRKQFVTLAAVLLVASLVSFLAIFTLSTRDKDSRTSSQSTCQGTCVSLYEDRASPDTLAVSVGSFVQFNSKDGKTHDLSLGGGGNEHQHKGKFQSGEFKGDEGWRVQFNEEGTYTFHDHYNPKVNVVLVVYTPGKDYKVQ